VLSPGFVAAGPRRSSPPARVSRIADGGIASLMGSDERSSGEQYPGPEPSESSEQSSDPAAAPGEHGHGPRGDRESAGGTDETVEVGQAAASFGPRLARRDAAPGKDEDVEPAEPAASD
jgi:hypothetical protein